MAGCVSGKKMYASSDIAENVLIDAWVRNDYPVGKGPVAVYKCADCNQFHLTSTGEMNPRLVQYMKEGKLKLQREAHFWQSKLNKK